ncbi:MAG: hypothetical protein ACK4K0_05630 [Flavobacteriales bacterium]
MTFARRFRYYLIGVGIGFILVFFIFRGKGFSWLPGNRVLISLQESILYTTPYQDCLMNCYSITKQEVFDLLENGNVNFKKSNTREEFKEYLLENDRFSISFIRLNDTVARLNQVQGSIRKDCDCPESISQTMLQFTQPDERIFVRLNRLEFEYTKRASCQLSCMGISSIEAKVLFDKGKVEHKLSLPRRNPNALFCILFELPSERVAFMVEEGKEKSRVLQVFNVREIPNQGTVLDNNCACD